MGLRDFFKAKRNSKFAGKPTATRTNITDEQIAQNWVLCSSCKERIYRAEFELNLNVCHHCGHHDRLNLSQRISSLVDRDTFAEFYSEVQSADPLSFHDGRKSYKDSVQSAKKHTGLSDAISVGTAQIYGAKVAIAIMNFSFLGGSMGSVVGERFVRIVQLAIKEGLPFICLSSSGGARMHEGILSLMQMAKTSVALAELSEAKLPYISILTDPTYGGVSASYACLGDYLIAEPKARIGFAGRRVIEETVKEKLPADFQSAEYLLEHGQIDFIVERKNLKSRLAQLLKIHGFDVNDDFARVSVKSENIKLKDIPLEFEKPLIAIQAEMNNLERKIASPEEQALLKNLKDQYAQVEKNIFSNLTPLEITRVARHPNRPNIEDYLTLMCEEGSWIELHGDRAGTDDEAIMTALVELEGFSFMAIGMRKGRNIKQNQARNFGMPQPEGYRKAKRMMELANKFSLPIVTFIDTPGAYPGLNAEANGQSIAIAENLKTLAQLTVPVIAIVTGEGGSGGALAIGVANTVLMLENSVYSVISPEGCSAILWKTRDKAEQAALALKITAKDLMQLGIIDGIISEPMGGAHRDWKTTANNLQIVILEQLKEMSKYSPAQIKNMRAKKFLAFGVYEEKISATAYEKNAV
jgi:acetyl-CoA carboxylase carboxyl transferase subunit beta